MASHFRKFTLTAHVVLSVGWLGAVVAYLALAVAGLTSDTPLTVRAAFLSMDLIGWYVIVPFALAAWAAGLVVLPVMASAARRPRRARIVTIHAIALLLVVVVIHLSGGGMSSH